MKKAILIVVMIVAFAHLASAFPFDFKVTAVNDTIFSDESAKFIITIYNTESQRHNFEVIPDALNWVSTVDPQPTEVRGFGTGIVTVLAKPKSNLQPGSHGIPIKLTNTDTVQSLTKTVPVYIKPFDSRYGRYMPSVALGADIPAQVDPREPVKVSVYLRNRNALNITGLDVSVSSQLFEKKIIQPLGPLMEDRDEYNFNLDPLQTPGTHELVVEISYLNTTVSRVTKSFEVTGYTVVKEETTKKSGLFTTKTEITVSNAGNAPAQYTISVPSNPFTGIFTKYSQAPVDEKINGENVNAWHLEVGPQATTIITINRNYQLGIAILVVIVLVFVLYFVTRTPIILIKEAHEELHKESGNPIIKVRILIKNRSSKPYHKIRVRDKIPSLAEVVKKAHVGTLQPSSVTTDSKKGTVLRWEMDVLEPQEERLVAYIIQSKLKIVGGFTLRPARLTYQFRDREKVVHSNVVQVRPHQ
ncbi:MAG: hypothetical protein ABIA93_02860 [Candidatus Woesearchaeota archaeon]